MRVFGSAIPSAAALRHSLRFAALLAVVFLVLACGDNKPDPNTPASGQGGEMNQDGGEGGDNGLPPLEEVEPADEDVVVPPAP